MSYSESNGQVTLTMSREDWEQLLLALGIAASVELQIAPKPNKLVFELLNRLNQGNPNYTPYQVEAKK